MTTIKHYTRGIMILAMLSILPLSSFAQQEDNNSIGFQYSDTDSLISNPPTVDQLIIKIVTSKRFKYRNAYIKPKNPIRPLGF